MRKLIESLFFPSFLRRIDEKILVKRPSLWATRLHRVAWPAILLALLTAVYGQIAPIDRPDQIDSFRLYSLWGIVFIQIGLAIYWLYSQDKYHSEREQGILSRKSVWVEFGAYAGALLLIGASTLTFLLSLQHRVRTVPDDQFAYELFLAHVSSRDTYRSQLMFEEVGRYEENPTQMAYREYLDESAVLFTSDDKEIMLQQHFSTNHQGVYEAKYDYLLEYLDMADVAPLQAQWADSDYSALISLWSRYTGQPDQVVIGKWDQWAERDSSSYSFQSKQLAETNSEVDALFDFAFTPNRTLWTMFAWLMITLPFAIHLSLFRFTFKHSGLKGIILSGVVIVGLFFTAAVSTALLSFANSPDDAAVLLGVSGLIAIPIIYSRLYTIPSQTQFRWRMLVMLCIFPLLIALSPYLLAMIVTMSSTNNDISLFEGILLYAGQFTYIPFLSWIKQKHTQLMSLPRS